MPTYARDSALFTLFWRKIAAKYLRCDVLYDVIAPIIRSKKKITGK